MIKGIDVSKHNGTINWKSVKASGVEFAVIRGGYSTTLDPKFHEYAAAAKANNIKIGVYWFSYALNPSGAVAEAKACINAVGKYALDLPIFYDFEDDTERYARDNGITYTTASRTAIVKAFCEAIISAGYQAGVYFNENYLNGLVNAAELKKYPLWLAKWPGYATGRASGFTISENGVTKKWGDPIIWQFTDSGRIPGMSGNVDLNYGYFPVAKAAKIETEPVKYADKYEHDGLKFIRCKSFRIQYFDKNKKTGGYTNYCNGGFFAYFKSVKGEAFTLPVGNLVCDCSVSAIPSPAHKYLDQYVTASKLRYGCDNNQSDQYKSKKVSTLVVPVSGKPYVADLNAPPTGCKYAISGVPTVRNGDDVDYYNYVKPMGFDESCMVPAYRNWLGVRDGEIWIITGKTQDKNYIYGMEFWKKVKNEHFDDIIALDGGGSYYIKTGGKATTTAEPRSVNNLVVFT